MPTPAVLLLAAPFLLVLLGWTVATVARRNRRARTFNKLFSARIDLWLNVALGCLSLLTVVPLVLKSQLKIEDPVALDTFSYFGALATALVFGMRVSRMQLVIELEEEAARRAAAQRGTP